MIKILDSTQSLVSLVNDESNGIGKFQPLEAYITEELNGIFEADITMLQTDKHFDKLQVNGLLKIKTGELSGEQIFRIYFISKPIDGKINIKAQHITYDLAKIPVKPFSTTGAVNTKNKLLENIIGTYPFDMMTDINNNTSFFSLEIPKSFRECLGGWEGSVLDTFGCEYEWDNLLVKMLAHRGTDEGVRISYGKNLTDFKQEENIENVFTSVLGYAVKDEQTYVGNVYHKIVSNYPRVKIVDFSNDYNDTTPTVADLTQKATEYATNNAIEVPNVSIDIKFVPLYQTEEYKNIAPLERVSLGDTVHVFFDKLNVEATSRVVKTVWDVNLDRYESVELGDTKANLTTLLDDAVQEAKQNITIDAGFVESEMIQMSQLIINGLGLHNTLVPVSTGGYRMYLHNKPTLAESDTQYVITASGFMVSQDYGQTWNSGWDSSGNAVVNSLSTIVLKALEIYGSYLCFGDYPNGKYIEATSYSNSSSVPQGVSFDGSGIIRMQPQEAFYVNNLTADGNKNYNRIILNKNGTSSNLAELINYDDTQNFITANFLELDAHYVKSGATYNRFIMSNYSTISGTRYSGNLILMEARENANYLYLRNYKYGNDNLANTISSSSTNTSSNLSQTNYAYNQNYVANAVYFYSLSANNMWTANNYKMGVNNNIANRLNFNYTNNTSSVITFTNNQYETSSGNRANEIVMTSNSTTKKFRLSNMKMNSDGEANYIEMKSETNTANNTLTIYSQSDVHINSSGAVRLTSGGSQDITLSSDDDIYMTWGNKLRMQGKEVYLSGGYVRYYE